MEKSNQIQQLALLVNQELSNYIKVHDLIHSESETFKSTLKNIFGFGTPMAKLLQEAESLIPVWDSIEVKLNDFRTLEYNMLSANEKHYVNLLSSFVVALKKTVSCLVAKQQLLAEGVEKFGSITMKEQLIKRSAYENAIEEYLQIGKELSEAKTEILK